MVLITQITTPISLEPTLSLDGRQFALEHSASSTSGDVGVDTIFRYQERDNIVTGTYSGGRVRRGYLIGDRTGNTLELRYVHLSFDDLTVSGRCRTIIETLPNGLLLLKEYWTWESQLSDGYSVMLEIPKTPGSAGE